MLVLDKNQLSLLISAVRDAIRYNEGFLRSETIRDVSDYEEHILCLENFAEWLRDQYRALEKQHPDLRPYDEIAP
jgi:hypothetical protein